MKYTQMSCLIFFGRQLKNRVVAIDFFPASYLATPKRGRNCRIWPGRLRLAPRLAQLAQLGSSRNTIYPRRGEMQTRFGFVGPRNQKKRIFCSRIIINIFLKCKSGRIVWFKKCVVCDVCIPKCLTEFWFSVLNFRIPEPDRTNLDAHVVVVLQSERKLKCHIL